MSEPMRCASCGQPLEPPGPGGLCPVCLLRMGLQASAGTGTAGPDTAGAPTSGPTAATAVPGVIGLAGPVLASSLTTQGGSIQTLAFNPDASRIVSGGRDGRVRVWDIHAGRQAAVVTGHFFANTLGVMAVAYSPDGGSVYAAGDQHIGGATVLPRQGHVVGVPWPGPGREGQHLPQVSKRSQAPRQGSLARRFM